MKVEGDVREMGGRWEGDGGKVWGVDLDTRPETVWGRRAEEGEEAHLLVFQVWRISWS